LSPGTGIAHCFQISDVGSWHIRAFIVVMIHFSCFVNPGINEKNKNREIRKLICETRLIKRF
uniref:hypothetical protein n=1 Tax=Rahnella sp. RFA10(1/100) TaxID=2511202 RepID=UPI001981E00A